MSFNTALSGLQAATVDLSATSNNIANVSTSGFKRSRAEFGDLFAVSPFGQSPTAIGSGVQVSSVSQQFGQAKGFTLLSKVLPVVTFLILVQDSFKSIQMDTLLIIRASFYRLFQLTQMVKLPPPV
jgi:hypothetical protein